MFYCKDVKYGTKMLKSGLEGSLSWRCWRNAEIDIQSSDKPSIGANKTAKCLQEDDAVETSEAGAVPPPKQLTLERQLNKSILIGK